MEDYIFNTTNEQIDTSELDKVIQFACKKMGVKNPLLNIVIVDNKKIQEINKTYRNKDAVTDVISFAFEEANDFNYDDIRFLGEIYISYERCVSQAGEYGHSVKREFCYLAVHGLLHLLGYDHMNEEDKKVMRALEEEILNEYDIKR
ncbi:MAG: rRNA maturation RNase YbeY [Bacilli bacterium]|nr:rRNA maturation RNase YbeY [Bacilli bacterium]